MPEFIYQPPFPLEEDHSAYRELTTEFVTEGRFDENRITRVDPQALTLLAETAFRDVAHLLRTSHLRKLAAILEDGEASENDRYVALEMLKNAVISAEGVFPMCQDTGTAIVIGKKGQQVWTGGGDEEALSRGVYQAYTRNNLRYSQNVPLSMFEEKNSGSNLPAQIELQAVAGDAYSFLFIAKGGGSSNKTFLYQETKAVLHPDVLVPFLVEKMKALGTAACPPYHLAVVIGGTSPEANLKTVKLASSGYLDTLPGAGNMGGCAFRAREIEEEVLRRSRELGIGAQFGGKVLLPRRPCDPAPQARGLLPGGRGCELQRGPEHPWQNHASGRVPGATGKGSLAVSPPPPSPRTMRASVSI